MEQAVCFAPVRFVFSLCFRQLSGLAALFNRQGCVRFLRAQRGVLLDSHKLADFPLGPSSHVLKLNSGILGSGTNMVVEIRDGRYLSVLRWWPGHILFDSPGHRARPGYQPMGTPEAGQVRLSLVELEDDFPGSMELGVSPKRSSSCQGPFSRSLSNQSRLWCLCLPILRPRLNCHRRPRGFPRTPSHFAATPRLHSGVGASAPPCRAHDRGRLPVPPQARSPDGPQHLRQLRALPTALPSAVVSTSPDGPSFLATRPGLGLTSCAQTGAGASKRRGEARPGASTLSSRSSRPSSSPRTTRGRRRGVPMAPALSRSARGWLCRTARARDGLPQPRTRARRRPPSPGFRLLRGREGGARAERGRSCASSGPAPATAQVRSRPPWLGGDWRLFGDFYQSPRCGAGIALAIVPSPFTLTLCRSIPPFSHFSLVPDSGTQKSLVSPVSSHSMFYAL